MRTQSGQELYTIEVGEGPEVAVVLHGGPGASHDYLRPQMDAAAIPGRMRLFYYDQRGGGRSPLSSGVSPGTFADHVADLDEIYRALGAAPLNLVGYSWGGLLAMLYAVAHPERVRRLALVSSAPAAAEGRAEMQRRLAEAALRPEVAALRETLDPTDRRARFALAVSGYFVDPRRALELTPFMVRQQAEEAVWRSLGTYDLYDALRGIEVPALVVHGTQDPIPIETAQRTAEALRAPFVPLEHCGHVPYIEAPEPLFAALRRFL